MSDSRPLEADKSTAGYHSLASFINAVYCRRWGYDFLYFRTPPIAIGRSMHDVARIGKSFVTRLLSGGVRRLTQERTCCYNTLLDEPRAAAWAKLLAVRDALSRDDSTVVYIDSDCIFLDHAMSVEEFVETTPVRAGSTFTNSCIGFLKNSPWLENSPCSGFFVAKNGSETRSFLREWWDHPNPEHGFAHDFEQSSLREIFPVTAAKLCVWDSLFFVEQEGQFLRHVSSDQRELRRPYFLRIAETLELRSTVRFGDVIAGVAEQFLSSSSW